MLFRSIHTPLINLSKAEIIQRGILLGVDYSLTVSCYQADEAGRACGVCDSCRLRRAGFELANMPDVTRYTTRTPDCDNGDKSRFAVTIYLTHSISHDPVAYS